MAPAASVHRRRRAPSSARRKEQPWGITVDDAYLVRGRALGQIRASDRLWRVRHSVPTFEEYCDQRWELDDGSASRLIRAAALVELFPANLQGKVPGRLSHVVPLLERLKAESTVRNGELWRVLTDVCQALEVARWPWRTAAFASCYRCDRRSGSVTRLTAETAARTAIRPAGVSGPGNEALPLARTALENASSCFSRGNSACVEHLAISCP
jgi:hypothetical protein